MKYLKFFVTILALFGISSCARDIIDLTCTIEGIVKDQTTGAPLSNCEILLTPTNKTITTSRDGIYSFTDLDPGEYSLTFNKSGYITDARNVTAKTGQTTKLEMLLQAKLAGIIQGVVKDKDNSYYVNKFNVISKRRGKKRAYIAIARKILVAIYHMLSTGEFFNPTDLSKVETSDKDKIKFTKNNFMQSTKQLISLGLTIDDLQNLMQSKISESTPVI